MEEKLLIAFRRPPKGNGVVLQKEKLKLKLVADEESTGPASIRPIDPDGNQILIDQYFESPIRMQC